MVVYLSRVGVDDGDGGLPPDLLVGHGRGGGRHGRLPRLVGRGRDGTPGRAAGLARCHVGVVHGASVGRAVVRGRRRRARRVRGHAAGLLGVRLRLLLGRDPVRRGLPLRHLGHGYLGIDRFSIILKLGTANISKINFRCVTTKHFH